MGQRPPQRQGLRVIERPGRDSLYLRGTVRGISVYESLGTNDRALAEEARAAREAELYRAAIHGSKPKVTFSAAALAYLEKEERSATTKINIGKLVRHFGPQISCDKIGQGELDAAGRVLCRSGAKPQSVWRQVGTPTNAILNFAARRGWCQAPNFEPPKAGGRRTDWITPSQAEAMITAAASRFRPLLTFLFCTGARVGEAIDLDWADVDMQHCQAVLRDTKNGDDRTVALTPRMVAAFAAIQGEREGRVFRKPGGDPYRSTNDTNRGAEGGQIKRVFASAVRAAGVTKHLTPHHCRHSWATWHYAVHRDPMLLRDEGGWRTISQVERYAKIAPANMKDEVLAFWGGVAKLVPSDTDNKVSA